MADFWSQSGPTNASNAFGSTTTTTGGPTQTSTPSTQSQVSVSSTGMGPGGQEALQELIAQLSDKPTTTTADATKALQQRGINAPRVVSGTTRLGGSGTLYPTTTYVDEKGAETDYFGFIQAQLNYKNAITEVQRAGPTTPGGTAETQAQSADRALEISRNRQQQGVYSKEAAFADAKTQVAGFLRQMMEQIMPAINKSVEASGTSGGAVSALLRNDAAAREAEAAAQLGLQTATAYGQISDQLATILEAETRSNPVVLNSLIQALGVSKGSVQSSVSVGTSEGGTTTTTPGTVVKDETVKLPPVNPLPITNSTAPQAINQTSDPFATIQMTAGGASAGSRPADANDIYFQSLGF